jgi:RNA polymerase sigma factor (sigma-70 family)
MAAAHKRAQDLALVASSAQAKKRLFATVVDLVSANGGAFKATARRYSICSADAEDAYQRGLEILMTKAPTEERSQLRPWLHTVIKHEALALRRQRERLMAGTEADLEGSLAEHAQSPEDEASEKQRAFRTAEALGQLKSSELKCMLLKALGYSYDEISAQTGFSWTKVNRSLTQGRKRFFDRFAQIESGERCEGIKPLLSAACDGEATSEDEHMLATHLRGCQSCRAAVRAYRAAPARLAELLPPALLTPLLVQDGWWSRVYESFAAGTGDRAGALGYKVQQAGELLSAQKATAVVASTAAITGGAAVHGHRQAHHHQERPHATAERANDTDAETVPAVPADPAPQPPPTPAQEPAHEQPGGGQPADEFTPEAGIEEPAAPAEAASVEVAVPPPSSPERAPPAASSEFAP